MAEEFQEPDAQDGEAAAQGGADPHQDWWADNRGRDRDAWRNYQVQPYQAPQRGLDAGLAKAMPTDFDGKASTYRDFRRRMELFAKLCKRRGTDCEAEGSLTLLQCLPRCCWEATRHIALDELENDGMQKLIAALDKLYRYDDSVEAPLRCKEYFEKFSRKPDETLNEYESRERELRLRLKEVRIDIPDAVSGWIALSRSGIPAWQEVTVKALCGGALTADKVMQALKQLYGGDHRADRKDTRRSAHRAGSKPTEAYFADDYDYEHDDEAYYEEDDWHEEAYYEDDGDDWVEEEEIPQDLDEAYNDAE